MKTLYSLLLILTLTACSAISGLKPTEAIPEPTLAPPSDTPTTRPTRTPTPQPTATLTNTPQPTDTPTPLTSPTATSELEGLSEFEKDCLEWGVVNYLITGDKSARVYITYTDSAGESNHQAIYLPKCIRYITYPGGQNLFIEAKGYSPGVPVSIKCQIYYKGKLVTESSISNAGDIARCRAVAK